MYRPETNFLVALKDSALALQVEGIIKRQGYLNVTLVDNGLTAINLLRVKPNYLLIISWELPGLSGLELIDDLRHHKKLKDLPVILTGSPQSKEKMLRARQLKVNAFQLGPPSEESLWPKIEKIIQGVVQGCEWPLATEIMADRLAEEGKRKEALELHRQSLLTAKQRAATFRTEIGIILMNQGENQAAVEALEAATTDDPSLARAQSALGQAYLRKGDPDSALRPLELSNQLDPQNFENQFLLVESLLQAGKDKRAEIFLERLVSHCHLDQFYFNRLAIAIRRQGQYEKAIDIYLKALESCQMDEHLLFNLSRCFVEAERLDDARETLQKALRINPDFPEAKKLLHDLTQ